MAHYDKDTSKFISDVSGEHTQKPKRLLGTHQIVGFAKDLAKDRHKVEGAIAKRVISLATKATIDSLEKNAGDSILGIYNMMNQNFKSAWLDWEPETLWVTLEREFGVKPTDQMREALMAMTVICKTNFPFEDYHIFEKVGHALNLNMVHFSDIDPLEPHEVAKLHKILTMIRPQEKYEAEVLAYIGACAKHAGYVFLPENLFPLEAQHYLDILGNDENLKNQVSEAYSKGITTSAIEPIGVQLERLYTIKELIDSLN
jgi:hypothetical protein